MGIRKGSISTPIIADGLVFNIDAANRASYPAQRTFAIAESGSCYNTLDLTQSGSLTSDPQFITQPVSASCWIFDGVDDVILSNAQLTDDMSICGWQKSTYQGASDSFYYPNSTFSFGISFGSSYYLGRLWAPYGSQTSLRVITGGPSNWGSEGTTELNDGDWHYVAYTFKKSSYTSKAYVDGNFESERSIPTYLAYSNRPINLGNFGSGTNQYWKGDISNVHAYNRALSANEVLHNYNALKGRFI
jgi:hypothetical protein